MAASTKLWKQYNGKGFAAEYSEYAERASKDERGNSISDTYATNEPMTGATSQAAGTSGLVPAPAIADKDRFLKGDGTWDTVQGVPSSTSADSSKVLEVNQSGNAEWAQHTWTSGTKNIPPESVVIGGRKYQTVQIGNQIWITKNLDWKFDGLIVDGDYGVQVPAAWYSNKDEATYGWDGAGYGLLYNAYAAKYMNDNNLLPDGWRTPLRSDWLSLIETVSTTGTGDTTNNAGLRLKAVSVGGTDDYGFSMLLPGIVQGNGVWIGVGTYVGNSALYVTPFGELEVYYVHTSNTIDYLNSYVRGDLTAGYSIRLVKDVV